MGLIKSVVFVVQKKLYNLFFMQNVLILNNYWRHQHEENIPLFFTEKKYDSEFFFQKI